MSTSIVYKNIYGDKEITSQQKNRLSQFIEQTFINGKLKKERKFYENKIEYIYVYIYPDDDFTAELCPLTKTDFTYTIAKDYQEINGYVTWKFYDYKNGILSTDYTMEVLDSQGRSIATAGYDMDGSLRWNGMKTYHIGGNIIYDDKGEVDIGYPDDDYILFNFHGGELTIDVVPQGDEPYTSVESFIEEWQELLPFMSPEILEYFTNVEPLVPETMIL